MSIDPSNHGTLSSPERDLRAATVDSSLLMAQWYHTDEKRLVTRGLSRHSVGVTPIVFHVWGSRGGRNTYGSRVGNSTSCYSLVYGEELFVFDAGHGLSALAKSLDDDQALHAVKRIHLLVTHAHMDHWEGIKDAEWMWRRGNGLELTLIGPAEALATIKHGHEPPAFVPLEVLAMGTLGKLVLHELRAGVKLALPGATLEAVALHHYSGIAPNRRYLETLGYRLSLAGGPTVAYLSDHEPTDATAAMEDAVLAGAQLAVIDANYADIAQHAFGHGSVEHASHLARRHRGTRLLTAHHGPTSSDDAIEEAVRRHAGDLDNVLVATEGTRLVWDAAGRRFTPS